MVHQLCQVQNTPFTVLSKIDGLYTFKTPVLSKTQGTVQKSRQKDWKSQRTEVCCEIVLPRNDKKANTFDISTVELPKTRPGQ